MPASLTKPVLWLTISLLTRPLGDLAQAQPPQPTVVQSPTVTVLTGLLAPAFEEEMRCYTCHQGEATPKAPPGQ